MSKGPGFNGFIPHIIHNDLITSYTAKVGALIVEISNISPSWILFTYFVAAYKNGRAFCKTAWHYAAIFYAISLI